MSKTSNSTPRKDGFRMPGEFEPHDACWMGWPERTDNWRYGGKPVQKTFAEVANTIGKYEKLYMAVSADQYENARAMLDDNITVVEITLNDSWLRDIGPSFVINSKGERRGVDWEFNAWGGYVDGLYVPWHRDDQVAQKILELHDNVRYRAPIVLEGGSIHVDGEGTCIVTKECLLSEGRNPDLNQDEITEVLKEYLNVEKVLWVNRGVVDDETNAHIDNILHYVKPGEVVLMVPSEEHKNDPQYERSIEALEFLESQTDAKGRKLIVHKMPMPGPLFIEGDEAEGIDQIESGMLRNDGDRLAGSYCNFYIGNGVVAMPLLDKDHDDEAMKILQGIFPERKIIGIDAREILLGGGNIHCITQQVPKA